ncbi:LANO_0F07888g1_1 [Lachancea nothofagi CBS 11611]|uniref:Inositol oxygenase n=1 Tax=Lachancea nothofagi CBS 11611 TaxID=1266666 RepID=A0A1G4K975_9SACH|nr:LANO_0F07888g1_1 [Lachancea nothofagi CBS 11611]
MSNAKVKVIRTHEGHLLELVDEDVQSVNAFKTRLKLNQDEYSLNDTQDTEHIAKKRKPQNDVEVSSLTTDIGSTAQEPSSVSVDEFRQYHQAKSRVREFYREQHEKQTMAFNLQARVNFKTKSRARMTIWEALCKLSMLIDDSDPDTELSQIDHALQTAEAIRADGKPRWMQLVGLVHDLGKILYFFDSEGQWDVVGDTFPIGCKFVDQIIFHGFFKGNPDDSHPIYSSELGIYEESCGLSSVMISWGHDEYMYYIAKSQSNLNEKALAMIRYHSFYPWHREGAYSYLMNKKDHEMLKEVQEFNKYDLYSKSLKRYDMKELQPYYLDLIDEFFPEKYVEF